MKPKRITDVCACKQHGFTQLTRGLTALFSPEDLRFIQGHNWYANPAGGMFYASRRGKATETQKTVKMHRELSSQRRVDHINNDSLDNRRENLRPCTQAENTRNARSWGSVPYKGVSFHTITNKYRARIRINGATRQIGVFDNAESAALAYNEAAKSHYGEFAYLNEVKNERI